MDLIVAQFVVPVDGPVIPDGAIAVELDKIIAVGTRSELVERYPQATLRHHSSHTLLPGLTNAHCHPDLTALGMTWEDARPTDHTEWLIASLKFRDNQRQESQVSALQASLKASIAAGTTHIGIMTGCGAAYKMAREMALRCTIFPEIVHTRKTSVQDSFESALGLTEQHADSLTTSGGLLKVGMGITAPYLTSRHVLKICAQHAKGAHFPLHVHAAESFSEMEFFFNSEGPIGTNLFPEVGWSQDLPPPHFKTPVQYLNEINFLDTSPTIIGGVQLGDKDFTLMARHMCRIIFTPRANKQFGHGHFPYAKLQNHGIPIGIGTEATTAVTDFDMWEELRCALETHSEIPATDLLRMATVGGARALHCEFRTGTLTPGKQADYIIVDTPRFTSEPFLIDALIRQTRPTSVRQTVVAGEILKNNL